jgi:hypothetical protein
MNLGLELIEGNLGFTIQDIVLIIVMLSTLFGYARDFKLGVILGLLLSGVLTIIWVAIGYDYTTTVIVLLIHVVLLTFSLYGSLKEAADGVA